MADKKGKKGENFLAFITGGLKEYGNIMAERTKLQTQMMSNQMTANQNWLYKLQQGKQERQMKSQRAQQAHAGGAGAAGYKLGYTPEGGRALVPPPKETQRTKASVQYNKYQELKEKGDLTPLEERYISDFEGTTGKNIADPYGLTSEQQLQGRALSKEIYGVKGARDGLPIVYEEMRKGKTIDDIRDELRFAGQSKEFTGPVRNAAQTILMNTPEGTSQRAMDYMDDLLTQGDAEGVKSQLKRLARTQAGTAESKIVNGKERTIKLLDEIQGDLNALAQAGINTNIFTGTREEIAAKVGRVAKPEMRKMATKIAIAIQTYRQRMSGAAFSIPESKEYATLFPSIGRTANFNKANIDALQEVMQGDLDNFYSLSMGERNYNSLFGNIQTLRNEQPQTGNQGRIKVISPGGKTGTIPNNQLDDALSQGYKRVQ